LCHVCGLFIDTSERFLAKHFVRVAPEAAAKFLKEVGED
jgi:hypothetical protein